jgi:hypothetical protein
VWLLAGGCSPDEGPTREVNGVRDWHRDWAALGHGRDLGQRRDEHARSRVAAVEHEAYLDLEPLLDEHLLRVTRRGRAASGCKAASGGCH